MGSYSIRYNDYKHRAKQQSRKFEITKDEYDYITNMKCYICNKIATSTSSNGVDKISNSSDYICGNIAPCCKTCNYIKYTYNINDMYRKIYEIAIHHFKDDIIETELSDIYNIIDKKIKKITDSLIDFRKANNITSSDTENTSSEDTGTKSIIKKRKYSRNEYTT